MSSRPTAPRYPHLDHLDDLDDLDDLDHLGPSRNLDYRYIVRTIVRLPRSAPCARTIAGRTTTERRAHPISTRALSRSGEGHGAAAAGRGAVGGCSSRATSST